MTKSFLLAMLLPTVLLSNTGHSTDSITKEFYNFPKIEFKVERETEILLTWERKIVEATAYNESEEDCDKISSDPFYGITASGVPVSEHRTIAMPDSYRFGTIVYIPERKKLPNGGIYTVEDRGGAITEGHLDLYIKSRQEGLKFGRKLIEIYVPHGGSDLSNRDYVLQNRLQSLKEEFERLSIELSVIRR